MTLMLNGSARALRHAIVCGWVSLSTKKVCLAWLPLLYAIIMASDAAVPSSSSDALAMSMPVRSVTIVWKLSSDSRRPCEISGWYGVYCVYHAGFSIMLRRITAGVCVPL